MLAWLVAHAQIVSAVANLCFTAAWLIYLQIIIGNYRRQVRATILITRGGGRGLDAHCFVCNMSANVAYVESIIVTLEFKDEERWVCPVTDLLDLEDEEAHSQTELRTRQGPLKTGDVRNMGTFRSLIRHVVRHQNGRAADVDDGLGERLRALQIEVLAAYGSEDLLVGAKRRFELVHEEGGLRPRGETVDTEQIRTRRERKRLIALLDKDR